MRPTVFDLFHVIAVISGILIGAQQGFKLSGDPGALVGGILGATIGIAAGYVCKRLLNVLMVRSVRKKSTPVLKAKLVEDDIPGTYVSGLIISVLLERGEAVESFRDYVFRQLRSGYVTWRQAGLYTLEICYPELAIELGEFHPFQLTEDDRRRLNEIELMSIDGQVARANSRIAVPYQPIGIYSGLTWMATPGKRAHRRPIWTGIDAQRALNDTLRGGFDNVADPGESP